jgi:hypothetical protein
MVPLLVLAVSFHGWVQLQRSCVSDPCNTLLLLLLTACRLATDDARNCEGFERPAGDGGGVEYCLTCAQVARKVSRSSRVVCEGSSTNHQGARSHSARMQAGKRGVSVGQSAAPAQHPSPDVSAQGLR